MDGDDYDVVAEQIHFSGPPLKTRVTIFDEGGVEKRIEGVHLNQKRSIINS